MTGELQTQEFVHPKNHWSMRIRKSMLRDIDLPCYAWYLPPSPWDEGRHEILVPLLPEILPFSSFEARPQQFNRALLYLELILEALSRRTSPEMIARDCSEESELIVEGKSLRFHLNRVLTVIRCEPEFRRVEAGRMLSTVAAKHYLAWLEMVETWSDISWFPDYSSSSRYRPAPVFYRAVPDTRVPSEYFDRWRTSRERALKDLESCSAGPLPGVVSVCTYHALGPFRTTELPCVNCDIVCAAPAFATMEAYRDAELKDSEWFIDSQTIKWCMRESWMSLDEWILEDLPEGAVYVADDLDPDFFTIPEEVDFELCGLYEVRVRLRES